MIATPSCIQNHESTIQRTCSFDFIGWKHFSVIDRSFFFALFYLAASLTLLILDWASQENG